MTPGVDGASNDKTLIAGMVIGLRGDFGMIDADPLLALAKLTTMLELFGAEVVRCMTDSASKFIVTYIYACHCSTHLIYVCSFQLIYFLEKG